LLLGQELGLVPSIACHLTGSRRRRVGAKRVQISSSSAGNCSIFGFYTFSATKRTQRPSKSTIRITESFYIMLCLYEIDYRGQETETAKRAAFFGDGLHKSTAPHIASTRKISKWENFELGIFVIILFFLCHIFEFIELF